MIKKKDGEEMELHFNGEKWNLMDTEQRVEQCRRLAEEAQILAEQTEDDRSKAIYLELAIQWLTLATEIHLTRDVPHARAAMKESPRFT